ncbi:MAG: hypothetical protein K0R61_89 [Microvirga sp.]|nr:hypothetical protein [Microvirga sp.]MDF2969639.1 hypothetical protein [Microvirga sp.]
MTGRRTIMPKLTLGGLVTPARVIPRLKAHYKAQVIRDLALAASSMACLSENVVVGAMAACANSPSFGPARRVAIPHAMVAGIDKPLGIFARLHPAIEFNAVDDEPVDLVLLMLGPEGSPGTLLRAMACGARRLRDRAVCERLRCAHDAEAMHAILSSDSWRAPEACSGRLSPPGGSGVVPS